MSYVNKINQNYNEKITVTFSPTRTVRVDEVDQSKISQKVRNSKVLEKMWGLAIFTIFFMLFKYDLLIHPFLQVAQQSTGYWQYLIECLFLCLLFRRTWLHLLLETRAGIVHWCQINLVHLHRATVATWQQWKRKLQESDDVSAR